MGQNRISEDQLQVCGARGAGSAAAQGVFLALRPHEVYMLVSFPDCLV